MRATIVMLLLVSAYMAILFAQVAHEQDTKQEAKAVCNLAPYQGRYLTCTGE